MAGKQNKQKKHIEQCIELIFSNSVKEEKEFITYHDNEIKIVIKEKDIRVNTKPIIRKCI